MKLFKRIFQVGNTKVAVDIAADSQEEVSRIHREMEEKANNGKVEKLSKADEMNYLHRRDHNAGY